MFLFYEITIGSFSLVNAVSLQGQENDIILISLVRSNQEGKIGYLSSMNRLCVAISRARCGLYLFGNHAHLAKASRKGWKVRGVYGSGFSCSFFKQGCRLLRTLCEVLDLYLLVLLLLLDVVVIVFVFVFLLPLLSFSSSASSCSAAAIHSSPPPPAPHSTPLLRSSPLSLLLFPFLLLTFSFSSFARAFEGQI